MYYILSLKWTRTFDPFFTWWGPNNCGYQFSLESSGKYTEEQVRERKSYLDDREDTIAIPVEVAEVFSVDGSHPKWENLKGKKVVKRTNKKFRELVKKYAPDWKGPRP